MAQGLFPEPVLKKRRLTMQLAAEIKKLSDDIVELENWSKSLSYNVDDTELDMGKLIHLHLAINYETDPETQSVLSISVPMGIDNKVPISLRQWIESRLANPLLKLDVSGLCWGIQRYWEATISRAKLWSRLEGQYRGLIRSRGTTSDTDKLDDFLDPDVPTLSSINPRKILPHLERTSMLFESGGGESLRAYFSCELAIDEWAGEPRLVPGISVSAPSMMSGRSGSKVEQDVKRLFHTILNEKQSGRIGTDVDINADAIVHAAEHILGVLFFDEPEKHAFKVKAKK
ncbi:hypothetical protein APSETT444_009126 [Aspergillus pseudonomiae]